MNDCEKKIFKILCLIYPLSEKNEKENYSLIFEIVISSRRKKIVDRREGEKNVRKFTFVFSY